jgi:hypothetical protein
MEISASEREMIEEVVRMGVRASVLLRGVMLKMVDRETLEWGLRELNSSVLMNKYFTCLVDRPDCVHLLNLLHLVYSLEGQLDYQIREYGLDSLKDDLQEINFSLQQAGESFDLQQVNQVI